MHKLKYDLTSKKIGKWTVIRFVGGVQAKWECICACGTVATLTSQNLRRGHTLQCKPCGMKERFARENSELVGKKFGLWDVLSVAGKYSSVRCACGVVKQVTSNSLRMKASEGCIRCTTTRLPFGEGAFRQIINTYRNNCNKFGRVWELTLDQARDLMTKPCVYCGKRPEEDPIACKQEATKGRGAFLYNGIDRQDNSKGYTLENCVTCCTVCNRAKHAMSLDMFITWITRLRAHNPIASDILKEV